MNEKASFATPVLSVLVVVHNVENFLSECLRSLHKQTYEQAEFIIVDDGSTDASSDICDKFSQLDSRFKVFHTDNFGTLLARKRAIQEAQGEFSIFLDGDDFLPHPRVIECEVELIRSLRTDIVRFDIDVQGSKQQRNSFLNFRKEFYGTVYSPFNIVSTFFSETSLGWVLWDKIYRTNLLKKTLPFIKKKFLVCATDAYQLFLTCFFASTFASVKTESLYIYRIYPPLCKRLSSTGGGVSSGFETFTKFLNHSKQIEICDWIEEFLVAEDQLSNYSDAVASLKKKLIKDTIWRFSLLSEEDSPQGFAELLKSKNFSSYFEELYRVYRKNPFQLSDKIYGCFPVSKPKAIDSKRTIGIFYHKYMGGGVQRVISLQIPEFLAQGHSVYLFTEEISENEYFLPDGVKRVLLPRTYSQGRFDILIKKLEEFGINTFIYHASSYNLFLFDLIIVKSLGVDFIATRHELTTQLLSRGQAWSAEIINYPHIYRLCDAFIVLNQMEYHFYTSFGIPVFYVPNPVKKTKFSFSNNLSQKQNIIWVGRLENIQKNYKDALEIFKCIVQENNDVIAYIIGGGEHKEDEFYVKDFIEKNKLNNKLIYVGFTLDVESFYKKADVMLITSTYETFPMNLLEAKSFGIPLVVYDMPYLSMLQDRRGVLSVNRHDKNTAVKKITEILANPELKCRLREETKQSYQDFISSIKDHIFYYE